jgi:FkbM family methyltransferase
MWITSKVVFSICRKIERWTAISQGKGYGSTSVQQEVKTCQSFAVAPPKLAIDIGGNIGAYSAELRCDNSELEIHIFEPSKTNIEKLRNRFLEDRLVRIVPLAVAEASGHAILFSDSPGSGLSSLTKRKLDHFKIDFETTEEIEIIRFEDYWKDELGSRQIDLVKIDIEGHELSALSGFGDAINFCNIIQFEFGGCNIDTRTFFQDFWYFFNDHNFDIYRITPFGAEPIPRYREQDEFFSTTNFVAVRRIPDSHLS